MPLTFLLHPPGIEPGSQAPQARILSFELRVQKKDKSYNQQSPLTRGLLYQDVLLLSISNLQ